MQADWIRGRAGGLPIGLGAMVFLVAMAAGMVAAPPVKARLAAA